MDLPVSPIYFTPQEQGMLYIPLQSRAWRESLTEGKICVILVAGLKIVLTFCLFSIGGVVMRRSVKISIGMGRFSID